jgi:hypothetical protein
VNLRALPDSTCVRFRRKISTPCSLMNCSSSSYLPRTPSAFQQASRKAFPRLSLAAQSCSIMNRMTVLMPARGRVSPVGREEAVERIRRVTSIHPLVGKFSMSSAIPSGGDRLCGGLVLSQSVGAGWMEIHRHFRTSGLTLAARWGSLPLGLSSCAG